MARIEALELTVKDNAIHCGGCEARIQKVLGKVRGVAKVKADRQTQRIVFTLDQDKTPLHEVLAKLEFMGYTACGGP